MMSYCGSHQRRFRHCDCHHFRIALVRASAFLVVTLAVGLSQRLRQSPIEGLCRLRQSPIECHRLGQSPNRPATTSYARRQKKSTTW